MGTFEQKMSSEELERAIVSYGPDRAMWPDDLRRAAEAFAITDVGKLAYDNARKLDEHMTQAHAKLCGQDSDVAAFLTNLKAIPVQFEQQHDVLTAGDTTGWTISTLIEKWFDPTRLWSPAGLVSQGAFASALLFAGLMVGAEAAGRESYEDYDISADLFDVSEQEYSIDG